MLDVIIIVDKGTKQELNAHGIDFMDEHAQIVLSYVQKLQKDFNEQRTKTNEQLTKTTEQLTKTNEQLTKTNEQLRKANDTIKNLRRQVPPSTTTTTTTTKT